MGPSAKHPLPPTRSLPPLRSLESLTGDQVFAALCNLHDLYCPLQPSSLAFLPRSSPKKVPSVAPTPLIDSGYASGNEDDDDEEKPSRDEDALASLRSDTFERDFAIRWLTKFIGRAEELLSLREDARQRATDTAATVLASFSSPDEEDGDQDESISRDFSFPLSPALSSEVDTEVSVQLNDAPLTGEDHTDVGLQSWGASIVLSDLMCSTPEHFGLASLQNSSRIVELGAGTGLISLVLSKLLPRLSTVDPTIVATDYHPHVLANLRANVEDNSAAVQTCALDWSAPDLAPPLEQPADLLVAADVIYAPQHATWLRDCAARLLAPHGIFWLVATVRPAGKFECLSNTVAAAFNADDHPRTKDRGRKLAILSAEKLEKRRGIGRGDESGYKLFKIGWAPA